MEAAVKVSSIFLHLLLIALILTTAVFTSYLIGFWVNYPSGFDALAHVFRTSFVANFWPDINWLPNWAGGMPHFIRYPGYQYMILGLITRTGVFTIQQIITGAAVVAIAVSGVAMYLFVNKVTSSKPAGFLASFIYLLTPATWELAGRGGGYSRMYAIPFMILSMWTVAVVVKDEIDGKKRKWPFVLTSIFLALSFLAHIVVGALAFAFCACWILTFVGIIKWKRVVSIILRLIVPAIFLTSPFLIPLALFGSSQSGVAVGALDWDNLEPFPWELLFNFDVTNQEINAFDTLKLSPFIYPLVFVLFTLGLIIRNKNTGIKNFKDRSTWFFILISIFTFWYMRVVLEVFKFLYAGIITHEMMLCIIPIFLGSTIAMLVVYTFRHFAVSSAVSLILALAVLGWALYAYRFPLRGIEGLFVSAPLELGASRHELITGSINNDKDFNYRFGTSTDGDLGAWFNIRYPYIPQTRDYFSGGIVNIDDDVYKTYTIWEESNNYPETEFMLDWYGVNKFVTTFDNDEVEGKYEAFPEVYEFVDETETHKLFNYNNPSPILSATNAPTILIIGTEIYDYTFRSFAQGNINSRKIIPVLGRESIDSYTIDELAEYDFVFLQNYEYGNREDAYSLLENYVRNGGALFVESNIYVEENASLPDPFPVSSVQKISLSGSWDFDFAPELSEFDESDFSPPVYQEGPWGSASPKTVKSWGEVLLSSDGKPLIVGGKLGSGKVIWSGMNLAYHTLSYGNYEEAKLLEKLLGWLKVDLAMHEAVGTSGNNLVFVGQNFASEFINPQKFKVAITKPFRGILFKQSYFPGWTAYSGGNEELEIKRAGPRMMYVSVPEGTREITFEFKLPASIVFGNIIFFVALLGICANMFFDLGKINIFRGSLVRYKGKVFGWWEKDEI